MAGAATVERWRTTEIVLTSAQTYADPFNAVDVTATFTGPGGTVITRPAFWDGGKTWKVRFAPTLTGDWSMTTTSNQSGDPGLTGVTASVQCVAYAGALPIYEHGFVQASTDGHRFTYADGTPFFYLGDTHWLMLHERLNTSNVEGVASQFKYTVDKRVDQGFTVYQSEAIHIPHGSQDHSGPTEEPQVDLRDGFTETDLPGFARMDQKFAYLADKGLLHATGLVTWAAEPGASGYTQDYMARLGKYWVARFGSYPVMWTVAQEIDPNLYGAYNSTTIELWYAAADAAAAADAYHHPVGPHMESIGNGIDHPSQSWWGSKPYHAWWPMQLQTDRTDHVWMTSAREFYQNTPTKPVVMFETPYEMFWTDTKGARVDGYRAFQTGMCGYGYGGNGTWNDLYTVNDCGTDYYMPQSYMSWFQGANLSGGAQMAFLKKFYTSLEWWKLVPRYDDAAWSALTDPDRSLVSSDGNQTYAAYFFGEGQATGTLRGMQANAAYEASWFDPRTGDSTSLGGIKASAAGEWTLPSRPTADDWMLLVKRNDAAVVVSPANGTSFTPGAAIQELSWTSAGASAYHVYFGPVASYQAAAPHGNLIRLTPAAGTTGTSVVPPSSLPGGGYVWILEWTDSQSGQIRSMTSSFTIAGNTMAVANGSFETTGAAAPSNGWAYLNAGWGPAVANNPYQENNLAPATSAHFTAACPGGGNWYVLMNGNTGSIRQDLGATVNAGDTLSVSFYGGRARSGFSTAAGGVFNASFVVDGTAYSMAVDTTTQSYGQWKSYTLTKTFTNSGRVSLVFSAVSGDPWLDAVSNVTVAPQGTAPLFVAIVPPGANGQVLAGSNAVAKAAVSNGSGAINVRYDLADAAGNAVASLNGSTAPDYLVDFGKLPAGDYHLRATATDGNNVVATSLDQVFTVSSSMALPLADGSFETPAALTGANGWGTLAAVWNPAMTNNAYQQIRLVDLASSHLTAAAPDGGAWSLLIANAGTIHQDLNRTLNAGDIVSVSFYAGRAREVATTSAGGVFNASFVVGGTRYTLPVDTTTQDYDTWRPVTFTTTVSNSGALSLEFSSVSGLAWLDGVGSVLLTPATPYTTWLGTQTGVPSGLSGFNDDPNGDGAANGLAWLLGGSAMGDVQAVLPVETASGSVMRLNFKRRHDAGNSMLYLQYSTSLSDWTDVVIPAASATNVSRVGMNFVVTPGADLDQVEAQVPLNSSAGKKLFVRLRAQQ